METLVFFGFLAAIIIVPQILRHRERARLHETVRSAFERGQPVPPELVAALQSGRRAPPPPRPAEVYDPGIYAPQALPTHDLRRGVIWMGLGLGFVAVGLAFYCGLYNVGGSEETFGVFSAIGAIPACVGLAYLCLWFLGRTKTKI